MRRSEQNTKLCMTSLFVSSKWGAPFYHELSAPKLHCIGTKLFRAFIIRFSFGLVLYWYLSVAQFVVRLNDNMYVHSTNRSYVRDGNYLCTEK